MPVISVKKLVKHYGSHVAVDGLSFEVERGKIVGFLGPNGAGKSTTLRILAGFLGKTSGEVDVLGHSVDSYEAKRSLGYMPEAVPLYPEMRVVEYLKFRAELKEVPRKDRKANIDDAMERARVTDVANRPIGALSKGYRQRVGLADALVSKPPLLILDEPTAGLDPNQMREVRTVIKDLGKEHTVLLSTHILSEVEASCDEVIVIAKGKLVARGTKEEIRQKRRSPALSIVVRGEQNAITRALASIEVFGKVVLENESAGVVRVRASWKKGQIDVERATERAVSALLAAGLYVRHVTAAQSTLEDVFAELTRDRAADSTDDATDESAEADDADELSKKGAEQADEKSADEADEKDRAEEKSADEPNARASDAPPDREA